MKKKKTATTMMPGVTKGGMKNASGHMTQPCPNAGSMKKGR